MLQKYTSWGGLEAYSSGVNEFNQYCLGENGKKA